MSVINEAIIEKLIGKPVVIDVASHDFGIVPGSNVWQLNEEEEFELKSENYMEVIQYRDKSGKRVEAEVKGGSKVIFKFWRLDNGKLLSLGTFMRKNNGAYHTESTGMPTCTSVKELLDTMDGKTVTVVKKDTMQVREFDNITRQPKTDANGQQIMREQTFYAFSVE